MTVIEKLFCLKEHDHFRSIEDSELILIAEVAVARDFKPGAIVVEPGTVLNHLIVVVHGGVAETGSAIPEPPLIGIESLVMERPIDQALEADPNEGARCLMISKGHFFTVINECPEILVTYLEQSRRPAEIENRESLSKDP